MTGGRTERTTRILTRTDVRDVLDLGSCIGAVESALRAAAETEAPSGVLSLHVAAGAVHAKGAAARAGADGATSYVALKVNANYFGNRARFGLPDIQGVIVLLDAESGFPLALLDSIEITIQRTGAATAVAARHLARRDANALAVVGCGNQGAVHVRALARVLPIARVLAYDVDREASERLAAEMARELDLDARAVPDVATAARASDVVVTCTPSRRAFLGREMVRPGTFVAAVGADNPEKRELGGDLLTAARLVVDSRAQCAALGELRHALAEGAVASGTEPAELGEVVAGRAPGRASDEELIVFDSTGLAIEDVAAAALVYERAVARGLGLSLRLDA